MNIHPSSRPEPISASKELGPGKKAATPQEVAKQFEEILVRQFVKTMTDKLFTSGLSGENGPGWMDSYRDTERDVMTEELSRYLTESGSMNLSELMLQKWGIRSPKTDSASGHDIRPGIEIDHGGLL